MVTERFQCDVREEGGVNNGKGTTTIADLIGLLRVYPQDTVLSFGEEDALRLIGLRMLGPSRVRLEFSESADNGERGISTAEDIDEEQGSTGDAGAEVEGVAAAAVERDRRISTAVGEWLTQAHRSDESLGEGMVTELAWKFDVREDEVREGVRRWTDDR